MFEPDRKAGGLVVTFPDFAYGVTQGETLEEASEMAADLLAGLVSDRIEFDLTHHSRLDQMEAAFKALGKELAIEIRDAA